MCSAHTRTRTQRTNERMKNKTTTTKRERERKRKMRTPSLLSNSHKVGIKKAKTRGWNGTIHGTETEIGIDKKMHASC